MKPIALSIFLVLTAFTTNAGEPPTIYQSAEKIIGYNRITHQPIGAKMFELPDGVYNVDGDSAHNLVLVLRKVNKNRWGNRGSLLSLDPESGFVSWKKDILRFNIRFTKDLILYNTDENTKIMNKHTGAFMHSTPYDLKLLEYKENKGLTWGGTYMDLMNNKVLWSAKLNTDDGPGETEYLNDTTMLIASRGLHLVDTRTGEGWHYKMATSKDNAAAPLVLGVTFGAVGIMLGSAMSAAYPGSFGYSSIYGLSSNMVYDTASGIVYYSAIKSTVALTLSGKELWKQELRKSESSKSYMWQQGDRLMLINLGYAQVAGGVTQQGTPFMVSYNKATGDTAYNRLLGKTGFVTSFNTIRAHTLMKVGHGLYLYNHITGDLVKEKELDKADKKNPLQVIHGQDLYVIGPDSSFQSLGSLHRLSFLTRDTATVYRLDDSLSTDEQWPLATLWQQVLVYKDLTLLRNGARMAILKDGEYIGFVDAPGNPTVVNDRLLVADGERLAVIPLVILL